METALGHLGSIAQPEATAHRPDRSPAGLVATAVRPAELLSVLRRHAPLIIIGGLAGALAAYAYASSLPKSYTAAGAIAVGGDQLAIPELQGALRTDASPDPMPYVRTEVQALGARQLLVRLVNELHLDRDPEFNAALRRHGWVGDATAWIKSFVPHPASGPSVAGVDAAVVNAASHALAITQDNRSLVIGVTFTAHDPHLAAAAVNRLIADYVADRANRRVAADQGANTAITQRIDQVRGDIDRIERQMQDLRARSGVVALRAGSVGQQQIEDLANEASRAAVQRSEIQANLARAEAASSTGSADELASVIGSETISRLREQEAESSGRAADLSARFGPNYPALRSAEADLGAIRSQLHGEANRIVASLQSQLRVAQAHEADIQAQLAKARGAGEEAQNVQAQLEQLQQDAGTRRALYGTLLERAQQTLAQPRADQMPDVRVLSNAEVPGLPSAPNMKLSAGLGGVAGGLLAGLLAFVNGAGRAHFADDAEIEAATGATVLASLRRRGRHARWDRLADQVLTPAAAADAAALRTANTRMRAGARVGIGHVVAFVGTQQGAAPAAVAVAFARIAAQDGRQALLIEADPGQLRSARVLGGVPRGHASQGEPDWRDAAQRDRAGLIDLLPAGEAARPIDAAGRVALENLLVEARDDYALIVIVAPPATDATALALARTADTTVLVVDGAAADPAATREASARLAGMSRARLGAIVLWAS